MEYGSQKKGGEFPSYPSASSHGRMGMPSAPPADAPPPYETHAAPSAMMSSSQQPVTMHGHSMPPGYTPPNGYQQCPYPGASGGMPPSQMYPSLPAQPSHPYPPPPQYPGSSAPHFPAASAYPGYPPMMAAQNAPTKMMAMPMSPYQQQHAVVTAQFDAGARFNHVSRPNIPPPPPGCPPNAAQMAMMTGQSVTVVADQKKGGLFKGSGSGGIKFW